MSTDLKTAQDDLAYIRTIVSAAAPLQATIGEVFFWAGVLYGGQCLLNWLQIRGVVPSDGMTSLLIGFVPTVLFCGVLGYVIWRERKSKTTGAAARALEAVFQGAGLANLVMALVFAYGSYRSESFGLWLYHPIVVCMFQGVAWYVAWSIVRRVWLAFAAAGWFVTTVALGMAVYADIELYLLILSVAMIALMAVPGWAIWRGAKRAA